MIKRPIAVALALALLILGAAASLRYAQSASWLSEAWSRRLMQILIGFMLAAYANLIPKQIGRPRGSPRAESAAQAALRVGGWSFTLAGLAYVGLWGFAPLPFADIASMIVVAVAIAVTLAYVLWSFATCRERTIA
jgi:hypothetical protein